MSVVFRVKCDSTRPGEKVFVTGSHGSLGNWSPGMAFPLATTADSYPIWSSDQLPMADKPVEYKYLVQRENRTGKAEWEDLPNNANRKVQPKHGHTTTVLSTWGAAGEMTEHQQEEDDAQPPVTRRLSFQEQKDERKNQDKLDLRMAETSMSKAAEEARQAQPLAGTLEKRSDMRRNFSVSLLDGADEEVKRMESTAQGDEKVEKKATNGGYAAAVAKSPKSAKSPTNGNAADQIITQAALDSEGEEEEDDDSIIPMGSHCSKRMLQESGKVMSLSALSALMPVEEKSEARKQDNKFRSKYSPHNAEVPVVIVTSEVAPYSKTGGLGLVASSYCYEFARNGHRTMCVAPKYRHYDGLQYLAETRVQVSGQEVNVKYFHKRMDLEDGKGTDMIFIEGPGIERSGGLYNGEDGNEYGDNLNRFTMLCLAAMEAPLILKFGNKGTYGDKVLFLANDWQAGLVPVYLNYKYRRNGTYTQSRCIYAIHNLGYQGMYHGHKPQHFFGIDEQAAADVMYGTCINLCKGALICADRVVTVSPNYAQEIQTPTGGFSLQDFVRAKAHSLRLVGILNGIDDCWNPETDSNLPKNFGLDNFMEGKAFNKSELQRKLGLYEDPNVVLIGFIGRLTWQKGVDMIGSIIQWLMTDEGNGVTGQVQLIMMGNGDRQYAETLRWAENTFPGRVCGYVGFDPKIEHLMMAGLDLFLMPSRYEPCGLPQMYSQQYGTLPIVTATGGLVDSVTDIKSGIEKATGFWIETLSTDKLKETVYKAAELYLKHPMDFQRMQRNAMMTDFYWPQAMDEYERHIDITLYDPPCQR
eukprot:TRINITY_DN294_c0_g2_i1.p1 TRINITY_DN294_c0_g2~~TRINITY_DN294_c0_g2_i1.p1  ORF type:complete len:810 (+),score=222.01 TRINITY_DN294_c0_g2_i1:97-2526(+)